MAGGDRSVQCVDENAFDVDLGSKSNSKPPQDRIINTDKRATGSALRRDETSRFATEGHGNIAASLFGAVQTTCTGHAQHVLNRSHVTITVMPTLSDVLEAIAILAGYTFTPILIVVAVALFIHVVLRYRRQLIDSDEENTILEPQRTTPWSHREQTTSITAAFNH